MAFLLVMAAMWFAMMFRRAKPRPSSFWGMLKTEAMFPPAHGDGLRVLAPDGCVDAQGFKHAGLELRDERLTGGGCGSGSADDELSGGTSTLAVGTWTSSCFPPPRTLTAVSSPASTWRSFLISAARESALATTSC